MISRAFLELLWRMCMAFYGHIIHKWVEYILKVCTLADLRFLKNFLHQGGVKSTVSVISNFTVINDCSLLFDFKYQ